jgi:hypothetical protein
VLFILLRAVLKSVALVTDCSIERAVSGRMFCNTGQIDCNTCFICIYLFHYFFNFSSQVLSEIGKKNRLQLVRNIKGIE